MPACSSISNQILFFSVLEQLDRLLLICTAYFLRNSSFRWCLSLLSSVAGGDSRGFADRKLEFQRLFHDSSYFSSVSVSIILTLQYPPTAVFHLFCNNRKTYFMYNIFYKFYKQIGSFIKLYKHIYQSIYQTIQTSYISTSYSPIES